MHCLTLNKNSNFPICVNIFKNFTIFYDIGTDLEKLTKLTKINKFRQKRFEHGCDLGLFTSEAQPDFELDDDAMLVMNT